MNNQKPDGPETLCLPPALSSKIFELTGEQYLRSVPEIIVKEMQLGLDYAFVAELVGEKRVRTLSLYALDRFVENMEYDLLNTPCNFVVGKQVCVFPRDVQSLFPNDEILIKMGVQSYMGVPLFSSAGAPLGLIAALGRSPMPETSRAHIIALLQIFASRAAAELERKHAEEDLKRSEENYRSIFDAANDAIFVHDIDTGEVISINKKTEEMFGRSLDESRDFSKQSLFTDVPGFSAKDAMRLIRKAAEGPPQLFEWLSKKKNGELFWIEVNLKRAVIGGVPRLLAVVREITDRKQAAARLKESETNLRAILDSVYDAIFIHNPDGTIIDVNRKMLDLYRVDREQALRSTIIDDFSAPDNPIEKVPDIWNRAIAGEDQLFEWKAKRPNDGSVFDVEVFLRKISLQSRDLILATVRDISARKKAEQRLKKVSREYELLLKSAGEGIMGLDAKGYVTFVNRAAASMLGYEIDELIGRHSHSTWHYKKPDGSLHPIEECPMYAACMDRAIHSGEDVFWRKDGKSFPIDFKSIPLEENGEMGTVITFRDITERKRSEDILKLTQFSVDHASVSAYLMGKDGVILYVNGQTCRTLGYECGELLGRKYSDLDPRYPVSDWPKHWEELRNAGFVHFETQHRKKDGTLVPMEMSSNYVSFGGREYNWAFGLDISQRKKAEQELLKISRQKELILESAGDGIFGMDSSGNHVLANSAGARMLGYTPDELLGRYSHSLWHHTRSDGTPFPADECPIYKTTQDGISRHIMNEFFWKKDGTGVPVEYTTTPIYEEHKIVGSVVSFRDIAERKRAQEALQESEERYRAFFESAAMGAAEVDPDTRRFVRVNDRLCEITGYSREELTSKTALELTHPDDRQPDAAVYAQAKSGRIREHKLEKRYIHKDGHLVWVHVSGTIIRDHEGKPVRAAGIIQDITARKQAEEALRGSEKFLRMVLDNLIAFVGVLTPKGVMIEVNRSALAVSGLRAQDVLGKRFDETYWFSRSRELQSRVREAVRRAALGEFSRFDMEVLVAEGNLMPIDFMLAPIYDGQGRITHLIPSAIDITDRKRSENALRESEERFRTLADNIAQFAWMADANGSTFWYNKRWFAYTGTTMEEMKGWGWQKVHHPDHVDRVLKKIARCFETGELWEDTFPLRGRNGEYRWFLSRAIPIRNDEGRIVRWFGTNTDITERMRMEEDIRHLAHHDSLTGLPNRRLFRDIVNLEVAQARRNHTKLAILFLDLDRFKEINDTLGHDVGDMLLKLAAKLFRETVRESDTVARIGGDEFNIILADIARVGNISDIAVKILKRFRAPFSIAGHQLNVTTSIGISVFPDDSEDIDTLLRYADIAMYSAKDAGRNTYTFFNPAINFRTIERMRLDNMLRRSIELNELVIHYQPQVDIRTGRVVCGEALARWRHPERGLLFPAQFIPLAEETGFITAIDEWMLRSVCAQLRAWHDTGLSVCATLNVSVRQFRDPNLVKTISSVLEETKIPPQHLDLEITESTAMTNVERTASQLRELREMGVHISIDDFGTGYSSLNYLKKLPIEHLKIDQSFIRDIAKDADDRAIISAVTSMARKMGIRTVAEGVETEEQLAFLRESECDEAQGFLFSKPLPAEEFRELIAQQ